MEKPKYIPHYASLSGVIIHSQWLVLTQSLTNVHGPKSFSAMEVISVVSALYVSRHEIFNNVVCGTSKASDQPAHTRSLIRAIARHLNIL